MIVFGALSVGGLGVFIGMALSIVGGAFAIAAGASPAVSAAPGTQRACLSCGMLFATEFAHCPHCGYAASQPSKISPPFA